MRSIVDDGDIPVLDAFDPDGGGGGTMEVECLQYANTMLSSMERSVPFDRQEPISRLDLTVTEIESMASWLQREKRRHGDGPITSEGIHCKKISDLTLMQRFAAAIVADDHANHKQVKLMVFGSAGTGKSTLINYISSIIGLPALMKLAFTGLAAGLIEGQTLHSSTGIAVNCKQEKLLEQPAHPAAYQRKWKGKRAIVIDEISMVSLMLLGQFAFRLEQILRRPNTTFGGLHSLIVGDFWQLNPYAGPAIHNPRFLNNKRTTGPPKAVPTSIANYGHSMLREFEDVCVLDEKKRTENADPRWLRLLANMSMGKSDYEDFLYVNSPNL